MDLELEWSPDALSDLNDIGSYIEKDSPYYAKFTIEMLFGKANNLVTFPYSGRVVPEINHESVRELIHGMYRIIYRIKPNKIEIVGVIHSKRMLDLIS